MNISDVAAASLVDLSNYSYSVDPNYQDAKYTYVTQIYYIMSGTLSILLNLYLIILFVIFNKLRTAQCNWLIIFQCISEIFIGYGAIMRAVIFLCAVDNNIIEFNVIFCTFTVGLFAFGYRLGQTNALLIALDRFMAIWKPVAYANRQGH
uniref:G-protein coupled receptors family 1 profile domain-containing protein n=1 Tax=Acrobeloides nanus TaxID=290746 RepID=A0A914E0G5_9BILA